MPVEGNKDTGYTFNCDEQFCEFSSSGWTTKTEAKARGDQHAAEHATGEPMPELEEFRQGNTAVQAAEEGTE